MQEDNPATIFIKDYCSSFTVSLLSTNPVSVEIFVDGLTVYDNLTDRIRFDGLIGLGDHSIRVYVTGHAFVYGKIYTYKSPLGDINSFIIDSGIPLSVIAIAFVLTLITSIVLITSKASDS